MNLKKRLSSLLLALVVAATMMGGMTGSAFADAEADAPSTDNVEVVLNGGTDHARVIGHLSKEWFRKNTESKVQVFQFASKKKAGKIAYVVGKGVPMEKFFDEIGISENELEGAELAFCQAPKYEQPNKFTLPMSQLAKATKVMKGSWDVAAGKDARTVIEGKTVTPILATAVSNSKYKTYEEAEAAAADTSAEGFWSAVKNSCLIGLTGAEYTGVTQQKDGDYWIDNPATDCNGKNAINDFDRINIITAAPEAMELSAKSLSFTTTKSKTVKAVVAPASAKFTEDLKWTTSNSKVAAVKNGTVTPTGIGSCTVTATLGKVSASVQVKVSDSAFKPGKVASFKAKNVKKKSVKLTWKKVSKATGYEVYRKSSKKGSYKKIATIKKGTTVKYTNKKLKKHKKYTYKIRAYRTVNKKTVKGSFTSAKTVKIKK